MLHIECENCWMQVALPGPGQSFAWMYSIEDPTGKCGVGAQVCLFAI